MRFLLWEQSDERRLDVLRRCLTTDWELRACAPGAGADVLRRELADADAVLTMHWKASMPDAPRLKLIQLPGAGLDGIDFDAVPARCAVCNVYEHEIGIAEFVVLALLEWEIRLCRLDAGLRRGDWSGSFAIDSPLHGELYGKTAGFIGYGHIARETARRLKPFGMRLRGCTRRPDSGDEFVDDLVGVGQLAAMLGDCDYVVVACPLSDATRGLIDRAALGAMKRDAVLVNVARGPVVDEDALFEACRERRIGGAVIDTWYRYPESADEVCLPSRHRFQDLDNVIMSPHASGWSAGLIERRFRVVADNLDRLARGEPLRNVARAALP